MYNMYDQSANHYTLRNRNLREGWAVFLSFATRAYAAETYGDVQLTRSNVEQGAFPSTLNGTTRYAGIYTDEGNSIYDLAGIGALLWSLYDSRSTTTYEYGAPFFASTLLGDNDDVNGYRQDVWESVRTTGASAFNEAGIAEVTSPFRGRMPSSVRPSVDDAYDYFLCPNFGMSGGCSPSSLQYVPTRRPRPVQASTLSGQHTSATSAVLAWDRNTYDLSRPFANAPDGYRIYRNSALIATVSNTTSSYTYNNAAGISGTYTVTAYNAAGESVLAPVTTVSSPLSASISTSGDPVAGSYVFTANGSGGNGAYTYEWRIYHTAYGETGYGGVVETSQSLVTTVPYGDTYVKVTVRTSSGEAVDAYTFVFRGDPGPGPGGDVCRIKPFLPDGQELGATEERVHLAVDLDAALTHLRRVDERACRVVELKFFGDLDHEQIAGALGVSAKTVKRDWEWARTYLQAHVQGWSGDR